MKGAHVGLAICWLITLIIGVSLLVIFGEEEAQQLTLDLGLGKWILAVWSVIIVASVVIDVRRYPNTTFLQRNRDLWGDTSFPKVLWLVVLGGIYYSVSLFMIFDFAYGYPIGQAKPQDWLANNFFLILGLAVGHILLRWTIAQLTPYPVIEATKPFPPNERNASGAEHQASLSDDEKRALEILGLKHPYTLEQLKDRRKALITKTHPDQGGTAFLLRQVEEAFQLLKSKT